MIEHDPPYDELIDALRRDWEIDASWDGLRRFWYIGWTEEHVARCKECAEGLGSYCDSLLDPLKTENASLRDQLDAKEHNERRNLREYARVCKECDELRALVQDLFEYATDTCLNATNGPGQTRRYITEGADLADRARRLGCSVLNDKEAE